MRASRFIAERPSLAVFNLEVAQDRIPPFAFTGGIEPDALYYDLQTQLHGNSLGRHGSGRSGIYRGHYIKGVGRTPAAANWSDGEDIYHGSGHLSVASALRERLITAVLTRKGLAHTIVPCEGILLAPLTAPEKRAIRRNESSSHADFAPADGHMIALSVKLADFARMANFVFALDHSSATPQDLGALFLDLERYLHPPDRRSELEGAPDSIARALDAAFRRGLENFRAYSRAGLFWQYLNSNFSLDGRFLDLETPVLFGAPFIGAMLSKSEGRITRELLGFEEFGFVTHWRLFIAWLLARLPLLTAREALNPRKAKPFLNELRRKISTRFSSRHLLFRDRELVAGAVDNLATALSTHRRGRSRLLSLARYAFAWRVYGANKSLPDIHWRSSAFQPAPATPHPKHFESSGLFEYSPSPDAQAFAFYLAQLSAFRDPKKLLDALAPGI